MKIVFVSHNAYLQGGAQSVLLDLVKGIKALHPHYLIYVIFPEQGTLVEAFLPYIDGYTTIKQPGWMVEPSKKSLYKSVMWISRFVRYASKTGAYLRTVSPDVVVTNTIASPVAALACKWGGYKHLWFIHEVPADSGSYAFLYPESLIVRWIDQLSFKVLVNSEYTLCHYKPMMLHPDKLRKIHLGVELTTDGASAAKPCYTLLLIGYFSANKGQLEAIEACRILLEESEFRFRLLLVGAGDDVCSHDIRQLILDESLEASVIPVNFTKDIVPYYLESDVLLMCSASEGFSKVLIEAQRFGLPVIATSIEASKELIEDGYNGLLYDRGDVKGLALAIQKLSDGSLRGEMSANALRFANGRYTMKQFVEEFVAALQ